MPAFIRRNSGLLVPTGPVEVDGSHPLAQGLVSFYVPKLGLRDFGPAGAILTPASGYGIVASSRGGGQKGATTAQYASVATPASQQLALPLSIFWHGDTIGTATANATFFGSDLTSGAAPYLAWNVGTQTGTNASYNINSAGSFFALVGGTLPTDKPFSMGMSVSTTAFLGYLAGRIDGTSAGRADPSYTAGYTTIIGTTAGANTRVPNKITNAAGLWRRVLTDNVFAWLEAEPFAFLQTIQRRQYYLPSSGNIVFRDLSIAQEFLAAPQLTGATPSESSASVFLSSINALETLSSQQRDAAGAVEILSAQQRDGIAPVELAGSPLRDVVAPSENNATYLRDVAVPVEGAASMTLTSGAMVESNGSLLLDSANPVENKASLQLDSVAPTEWTGVIVVTLDEVSPLEWRVAIQTDSPAQVQVLASTLRDVPGAVETLATAIVDGQGVFSMLGGVARAGIAPVEWGGGIGVTLDVGAPIEFRASLFRDAADPMESAATFHVDVIVPVAGLAATQRDAAATLEILGSAQRDDAIAAEWTGVISVILDAIFPLEWISAAGIGSGLRRLTVLLDGRRVTTLFDTRRRAVLPDEHDLTAPRDS